MPRTYLLVTVLYFVSVMTFSNNVFADEQFSLSADTSEPNIEQLYAYPVGKDQSEAIIFYNSNLPYQNQNDVINKTYSFIKDNYSADLQPYIIDVVQNTSYLHFFKLSTTISLVLIKIQDGSPLGYRKMENLQNFIEEPDAYENQLSEFINNFLIWN